LKKIVALIPAAGYSSRMGFFKPLLPTGSALVIENVVNSFLGAGIEDIRIIVGYKAELLRPVLNRLGMNIIENLHYAQGMYTSVQAGVRSLENEIDAFFFLPVDYAFVSSQTILSLLQAYRESHCEVIFPICQGKKGHPPLISVKLKKCILEEEPQGGLKKILAKKVDRCMEVKVQDEGVLIDLDSEGDYRKMIRGRLPDYPDRQECLEILQQKSLPASALAHVQAVANVSGKIAEYLNSRGFRLHLGLIMAASLLHDIAKGEKNHAQKGSEYIDSLGYPAVADIVASHMVLAPGHWGKINETTIVYMSDKLIAGDKIVSLEKRLEERLSLFKEDAERQVRERIEQAWMIQKKIESVLQIEVKQILGL
jgi:molybdenum cofactor cytidylyltransferase